MQKSVYCYIYALLDAQNGQNHFLIININMGGTKMGKHGKAPKAL